MVNSELVAILRTFSVEERRRMEDFFNSPYFFKEKKLTGEQRLVAYIFDSIAVDGQSEDLLQPECAFAELFPGRPFSAPALNNLIGSALKVVRQFIETDALFCKTRPVAKRTMQVNFFLEKEDFELGQKYLNRLEQEIEGNKYPDDDDFMLHWMAAEVKTVYLGLQSQVTGDFNLKTTLQSLEDFYLIRRLNTLTALFNLSYLTPILDWAEREALIQSIDAWAGSAFFQTPIVQLSRMALLIFHYDDKRAEQVFHQYMDLLTRHEKDLSLYYLKRLEDFAYNFCSRRFQRQQYKLILVELFKRRTKPERLDQKANFQANEFLSLVKMGILLKQFDWVAEFLEHYRHRIVGAHASELYYQFNLAQYYFAIRRYEAARDIVVPLMFHETHYKYFSKALEIKCYYETEKANAQSLESSLLRLKVMLSRESKMTPDKVKRYKNFVNLLTQIDRARAKNKPDSKHLAKIGRTLNEKNNTAEWSWLVEKLKELGWTPPQDGQDNSSQLTKD